jgi:hypothetical protein
MVKLYSSGTDFTFGQAQTRKLGLPIEVAAVFEIGHLKRRSSSPLAPGSRAGHDSLSPAPLELLGGRDQWIRHLTETRLSPHPHLQIRHRHPDVAFGPFRYLSSDCDRSAPALGEECRESLVVRWLEANRLKAGLETTGRQNRWNYRID